LSGLTAAIAAGAILPLSLAVDRLWGEPPVTWHPVVAMGKALERLGRWLPSGPPGAAFVAGAAAWTIGASGVLGIGWLAHAALLALPLESAFAHLRLTPGLGDIVRAVLAAALLKPLLALRCLLEEVVAVELALGHSLAAGRERVARICSRDTGSLGVAALRETTVESLAENLADSVIAPLFWFAVAGLPGAALYRWANTADAMWGYRDPARQWSGKFAARADDVLSWIPSRLAALLLCPVGRYVPLRREARRTPSPNGGWPMAAMASRLGVRLGKPGVYAINADAREIESVDVSRAVALARRAAWCGAFALGLALAAFGALEASPGALLGRWW